jgi:hypothetical protein
MGLGWKIGLLVWLGFVASVPQALAQTGDQQIIITSNGHPVRLLGFIATGPQPDLERLLAAAESAHFFAKELPPPDGPEVMVMFKPGSDPKAAVEFFTRAQTAEFSTLRIGAMIYPVSP